MLKFKKHCPKAQRRCFKAVAVRELVFKALKSKVTGWKVEIEEGGGQRGADTILCNNEGVCADYVACKRVFFSPLNMHVNCTNSNN